MEARQVKRQLPEISNEKKKTKSRPSSSRVKPEGSTDSTSKQSFAGSSSSVIEAGERLSLSPPGTKPRIFLGYTTPFDPTKPEGEDSSVMVAVRVRPFSER